MHFIIGNLKQIDKCTLQDTTVEIYESLYQNSNWNSLKQKTTILKSKMVQIDLDERVREFQESSAILVLCKHCRNEITLFRYLDKYDNHFWEVEIEEINTRCVLKFRGKYIMCTCKYPIGIPFNGQVILLRRNAVIIDH